MFAIDIHVHWLFLAWVVYELLDGYYHAGRRGMAYTLYWSVPLFVSVLLHEFGHCFAARRVGGSAHSILLWPLGGLAFVSPPHHPRAERFVTAAGPAVNLALAVTAGGALVALGEPVTLNPFWGPATAMSAGVLRYGLAMTYFVNWILFLFNLIPAFPMDGGRVLRSFLWERSSYVRATMTAAKLGQYIAIVLGLLGLLGGSLTGGGGGADWMLILVAVFIYFECHRTLVMAQHAPYMESAWEAAPAEQPPRTSWWQRVKQRRRQKAATRHAEDEARVQTRVDELLEKVSHEGLDSLTRAEREFLKRVSERYRERGG